MPYIDVNAQLQRAGALNPQPANPNPSPIDQLLQNFGQSFATQAALAPQRIQQQQMEQRKLRQQALIAGITQGVHTGAIEQTFPGGGSVSLTDILNGTGEPSYRARSPDEIAEIKQAQHPQEDLSHFAEKKEIEGKMRQKYPAQVNPAMQGRVDVMAANAGKSAADEIMNDKAIQKYTGYVKQSMTDKSMLLDPDSPINPQRLDGMLRNYNAMAANAVQNNLAGEEKERLNTVSENIARKIQEYAGQNVDLREKIPGLLDDFSKSLDNLVANQNKAISDTAFRKYQSLKSNYQNVPNAQQSLQNAYDVHKNYIQTLKSNPEQFDINPIINAKIDLKTVADYASKNGLSYGAAQKLLMRRGYGK
jgi:hypothetical protein